MTGNNNAFGLELFYAFIWSKNSENSMKIQIQMKNSTWAKIGFFLLQLETETEMNRRFHHFAACKKL
jgi:hypothetical protein